MGNPSISREKKNIRKNLVETPKASQMFYNGLNYVGGGGGGH